MRIKPKKSLGQNFLIDKNIQAKIIAACEFKPADIVLEIGSGRGELTSQIQGRVNRIYGLEIDRNLCALLREKFTDCPNIEIINEDILKFNLKRYYSKIKNNLTVIGNIPYYISSPIIARLFNFRDKLERIFITVQKEFAQRLAAVCGSKVYGSLSCFVQYYSEPEIIFNIKNSCFFPKPKVDSSFLRLTIRKKTIFSDAEKEKALFSIIRSAFNKRRKTLRNSLANVVPKQSLELFFNRHNINKDIRPEDLSLQDFANLVNIKSILKK